MSTHPPPQAEGLWQLDSDTPSEHADAKPANDHFTFAYDGRHVTLRLLSLGLGRWKSADDFYKLESRWEGDTLCYRPPFGAWTELASFEDGRFVNLGSGRKRVFARIGADAVAKWNAAILAPGRVPHDYAIQADGSRRREP